MGFWGVSLSVQSCPPEDTCAGRYPSRNVTSCALGSSWSWIPACAGIIGGAGVRDKIGSKLLACAPFRMATSISRIGNRTKRLKLHQTTHVCTPLHGLFWGIVRRLKAPDCGLLAPQSRLSVHPYHTAKSQHLLQAGRIVSASRSGNRRNSRPPNPHRSLAWYK